MAIRRDNYQSIADCIRMDQVSAPEIVELFEDSKFHKWYRRKYLLDALTNKKETERAIDAAETSYKKWKKNANR